MKHQLEGISEELVHGQQLGTPGSKRRLMLLFRVRLDERRYNFGTKGRKWKPCRSRDFQTESGKLRETRPTVFRAGQPRLVKIPRGNPLQAVMIYLRYYFVFDSSFASRCFWKRINHHRAACSVYYALPISSGHILPPIARRSL